MESPNSLNCMNICNNNLFARQAYDKKFTSDIITSFTNPTTLNNQRKHPGQAVKIITDTTGEHKIIHNDTIVDKEVRKDALIKESKSYTHFNAIETPGRLKRTNTRLKECKSCDENLIKFIFTKHGIQVISDVETIV